MGTLSNLRRNAGYRSADDFADVLGLNARTYRNYENGNTRLSLDFACKVCDKLGCTLNELAGRTDLEPKTKKEMLSSEEQLLLNYFSNCTLSRKSAILLFAADAATCSSANNKDK